MPRQNFLSTDFFVSASEDEAKKAVCSIPLHLPHITLLKENALVQSMRFLYEHQEKGISHYVDVTMLPLNDQCIRFSLHGSYTNGNSFNSDPYVSNALYHFEQAVYAALKNDFSAFAAIEKRTKPAAKKSYNFLNNFLSIFVSKYHY